MKNILLVLLVVWRVNGQWQELTNVRISPKQSNTVYRTDRRGLIIKGTAICTKPLPLFQNLTTNEYYVSYATSDAISVVVRTRWTSPLVVLTGIACEMGGRWYLAPNVASETIVASAVEDPTVFASKRKIQRDDTFTVRGTGFRPAATALKMDGDFSAKALSENEIRVEGKRFDGGELAVTGIVTDIGTVEFGVPVQIAHVQRRQSLTKRLEPYLNFLVLLPLLALLLARISIRYFRRSKRHIRTRRVVAQTVPAIDLATSMRGGEQRRDDREDDEEEDDFPSEGSGVVMLVDITSSSLVKEETENPLSTPLLV